MARDPRRHGTYAMYVRGPNALPDPAWVRRPEGLPGCRCAPCSAEARRRGRVGDYLRQTGRSAYVDAGPARAHVARLLEAGMTRYQVAELTGGQVDRTQVRALMVGQGGRPPGRRVRRATEAALLAVPVMLAGQAVPERGTVPAVGTVRRLQALMADGYRPSDLARRLQVSRTNLASILTRDRVLAVTARAVGELWTQVQHGAGGLPAPDAKVAARYRARGWAHSGWWDAETLDDPAHVPPVDVPGGARDRSDARQERRDTVAELLEQGLSAQQVLHELLRANLVPAGTTDDAGRRLVERDKAWWRERGRALDVPVVRAC